MPTYPVERKKKEKREGLSGDGWMEKEKVTKPSRGGEDAKEESSTPQKARLGSVEVCKNPFFRVSVP